MNRSVNQGKKQRKYQDRGGARAKEVVDNSAMVDTFEPVGASPKKAIEGDIWDSKS